MVQFLQRLRSAQAGSPLRMHLSPHHSTSAFWSTAARWKDTFYRDLLGFRPYWSAAWSREARLVSQQAPDSHDWMDTAHQRAGPGPAGRGFPAISLHDLGGSGPLSMREDSRARCLQSARDGNRLTASTTTTQDRQDGKYQFNLYDPDGIRID